MNAIALNYRIRIDSKKRELTELSKSNHWLIYRLLRAALSFMPVQDVLLT